MSLHLPVAGQEGEAEGDGSSGDEDAVEDRQHCQDLSKCQLWNKDMILLIVMLLLMMMIVTFKMLKFSSLFLQNHDSSTYNGIMQLYQGNSICFPKNVPVNIIATLVVDRDFQRLFMMFVLK